MIDPAASQPLTVVVRDDGAVQATIAQVQRIELPTQLALSTLPTSTDVGASTPAPRTPNVVFTPPQLLSSFGNGVGLTVLSAPRANEPADAVTLTQARSMLAPSGGASGAGVGTGARTGTGTGTGSDGMREVRVPVSRNSLAEIVNGGVRLPDGVEQVLFVVTSD